MILILPFEIILFVKCVSSIFKENLYSLELATFFRHMLFIVHLHYTLFLASTIQVDHLVLAWLIDSGELQLSRVIANPT